MNAPAVKGWCPGVLTPMESGDGLIVRLKITGGIVPSGLAAKIADWSGRWGNGEIDLTSRANPQLRGVAAANLPALQDAVAEAGLLDADPAGEAVRNVIASPLAGLDPNAVLDIRPVVAALEVRLAGDPALHTLPPKFGFLIDDGSHLSLRDVRADIRFEAVRTEDGPAFAVGLDGSDVRFGPCRPDRLVDVAAALALAFLNYRNESRDIRRMRDLTARINANTAPHLLSASPLEGEVGNALALTGGGAGAPIEAAGLRDQHPPPAAAIAASTSPSRGEANDLKFLRVCLPFGRITTRQLAHLAQHAAAHGAHEIRLTPWRAIVVPLPNDVAALSAELAAIGLILDPGDPRLRIAACTGAPGCDRGTTATRDDAARLAPFIGANPGIALHVSGCAKGCAHPRSAPVTLVGRDGRYDLILNGAPSDLPSFHALTLDEAARHLRQITADQSKGGTA